jgi:uncharacterized membrane protein YeaQ/YmgE (transglycosylase-associated protein family)
MKTKLRILYGVVNYVVALLLLSMPFIKSNSDQSITAHIVTSFTGAVILVVTVLTNFEMGLLRRISLRENLTFGLCIGVFMLASPFIFGFYPYGFLFHLISGITISLLSAFLHRSIFVHRHRNALNA